MIWQEALRYGEKVLSDANVPEAALNAWYLFSHVLEIDRSNYFLRSEETMPAEKMARFEKLLKKRMTRMPLEYIIGETEFMGLPFYVNEHTLIPRQDTECLVEELLPLVEGKEVLDMCTGSGCIGISIATHANCRSMTLVDLSEEALEVAKRNAERNGTDVSLLQSDLFENVTSTFDVIVSNPPYVTKEEWERLMPEVRDYEPQMALVGEENGLYFYRKIIEQSSRYLHDGGWLYFEIGCEQGEAVCELMKEAGYDRLSIKRDLAGLDRIVGGRLCLTN